MVLCTRAPKAKPAVFLVQTLFENRAMASLRGLGHGLVSLDRLMDIKRLVSLDRLMDIKRLVSLDRLMDIKR